MPERKDGNKLKKIMNDPSNIVEEMLEGLVKSYPELVHRVESSRVVAKNQKAEQVGLVSGGGSGHEPSHAGFVGEGMLSAAVLGDVFTSPTPDQIQTAIKEADSGKGVLLIVKNYTGDALNFDMAKELAAMDDIEVESVIVDDDIAVENSTYTAGKRGVAGTILVHKIVGDAARNGASLAELKELGEKVNRAELIAACLKYFEEYYEKYIAAGNLAPLKEDYEALLLNRNNKVRVLEPNHEYTGLSLGINEDGELLVEKEDGTVTAVYAGEVSVRGVYGYV